MKPRTVDTKTRFQSVFARHQRQCALSTGGKKCTCTPRYFGVVWDREARRHRKTPYFRLGSEASNARRDLQEALRQGKLPRESGVRFDEAVKSFLKAVREGVALSKRNRPYKPKACASLEGAFARVPESISRKAVNRVTRGEVQALIDDLGREGLSSSRINNIVNSLRALYVWAEGRDLATESPAENVRLPAKDEKARSRIATPAEFATLLRAISLQTSDERKKKMKRDRRDGLRDSIPYALAGYASARHQEIQTLDWKDVDFKLDALELAADEEGRKPGGSWRIVPMVAPLRALLREEWLAQGRPKKGKVCPPQRNIKTGRLALNRVHQRTQRRWRDLALEPIGFQDLRHTMATWLDHAGVSPKVSSEIMGHRTPTYRVPGAARITQDRYTHVLPGELERARKQLDVFLEARIRESKGSSQPAMS